MSLDIVSNMILYLGRAMSLDIASNMILYLIIGCGTLGVIYGLLVGRQILAANAGSQQMQPSPPPSKKARPPISTDNTRPSPPSAW